MVCATRQNRSRIGSVCAFSAALASLITPNEGAGNKGGHLPNDSSRVRRYVPSNSTLNAHLEPLELYQKLAENAAALASALKKKGTPLVGGISFDEITISRGYSFCKHLGMLVGASSFSEPKGGIRLVDVKNYTLEKLRSIVGSHVLQLFWTSLDGKVSVPIGYVVTQGADPKEITNKWHSQQNAQDIPLISQQTTVQRSIDCDGTMFG